MKEEVKGASVAVAIIAMIIGTLVGFAFGINDDGSTTTLITEGKTQVDSPAPKLQHSLTLSYAEYNNFAFQLLEETHDQNGEQGVVAAELDDISEEYAALLARTFKINEGAYLEALRDANGLYTDYVKALQADENEELDQIRDDLQKTIDDRVELFAENITNISAQDFQSDLENLNGTLLRFIDEYDAGNFEVAYSVQRDANGLIKTALSRLTRAAVAEFPERYSIDKENNKKE